FFFFSSRRRHTRFSRDWSSDVCSSDLAVVAEALRHGERLVAVADAHLGAGAPVTGQVPASPVGPHPIVGPGTGPHPVVGPGTGRSEERRVGKEGRCRGRPHTEKRKENT